MYESEISLAVEEVNQLPTDAIHSFTSGHVEIVGRSVLPWGEHCTECAMPHCFKTCSLYDPREDGKCRRFVSGFVRLDLPGSFNGYLLKVEFKKWGKLWCNANAHLFNNASAQRLEKRDLLIARGINKVPDVIGLRNKLRGKRYGQKKRWSKKLSVGDESPDCFYIEVFHPGEKLIELSLTIRPDDESKLMHPYQKLLEVESGYNEFKIPYNEMAHIIDFGQSHGIDVTPNDIEGNVLYFGALDFIKEADPIGMQAKNVKCVVWDLDNTLWHGVLVEDGAEGLHLRQGIEDTIRKLDERGVLQSIASKNNHDEAMAVVQSYGLSKYFLFPKISWEPKSQSLREIAHDLNINVDTFLFIDDSPFERAEVSESIVGVRTMDAEDIDTLFSREDLQAVVTRDSQSRRSMYQENIKRKSELNKFEGNYFSFLEQSKIVIDIHSFAFENIDRVFELVQRTNQMNFSGNRYEKEELNQILSDENLQSIVIGCNDRFGKYGTVGFCLVNVAERTLTDMVFSCRVQAKRVEHAVLSYLLKEYVGNSQSDFYIEYRPTDRNERAAKVFYDFDLKVISDQEGLRRMVFEAVREIPDDNIITILEDASVLENLSEDL